MTIGSFHAGWAWVVVITNAIAGLWALGAHWQTSLRSPWFWRYTTVAQATIFLQAVLGAWMVGVDGIEAPGLHTFYGFVALFTVGMIYAYRSQATDWLYLLYGGGELFLMGLAIRAMLLSAPGVVG